MTRNRTNSTQRQQVPTAAPDSASHAPEGTPSRINRREFQRGAIATAATAAAAPWLAWAEDPQAGAQVAQGSPARVISQLPHYHGWPTIAQGPEGELWVVCSGGRESHVCPFGRVELMRSKDQGRTWSWPRTLYDGPIDDRDAGVLVTSRGTVLVTTFTSLAYEGPLKAVVKGDDAERKARWLGAHQRLDDASRRAALGVWMMRSEDDGLSFSAPSRCLVNSPHGPIETSQGTLLYAGKELWKKSGRIGVCVSDDDGRSWKWLAQIPARPGDQPADYHELHAVEAANGDLIVHIRNHNAKNSRETLQSRSADGGKTWTVPRSIGVWGLPSHLLRLRDGRLLMTYGHRRPPFGNQARVSEDHGRTWSDPTIISADGAGGDLGYPSTVELPGSELLTVWYEKLSGSTHAVLRQRRWQLPSTQR